MKVTQNVIHDLLPAYLAGEASADTVALVEEFLRLDSDLARTVEALRASPLPELPVALRPTQEKETLNMTKQLLRWRGTDRHRDQTRLRTGAGSEQASVREVGEFSETVRRSRGRRLVGPE